MSDMIKQGLLFPDTEQEEFEALERSIAMKSKRFGELSEEKRKFVIFYLKRSVGDKMSVVAARAGVSKTKAYELAHDPEVCDAMATAAQAVSDTADIKGSRAMDITAEKIYQSVLAGTLSPKDWTPTMLRICEACKSRLGLNPDVLKAVRMQMEDVNGNKMSATLLSSNSDTLLDRLAAEREGSGNGAFEAETPESVRGQFEADGEAGKSPALLVESPADTTVNVPAIVENPPSAETR